MATKRTQIVGYVDPLVRERMERLHHKNRFLTISVMVDMAVAKFLPELEKDVAKGRLPQPVSPGSRRG